MAERVPLPTPENAELERFIGGLHRWAYDSIKPGSFLSAVLRNDLKGAFACGDRDSISNLHDLVTYIHCNLPGVCWGSEERFNTWEGL